ncbi:peptidase [Streptomyces sp. NBC_01257]|uniref:peptidase n=1 Tax=Streptomyces sp. NBC_01257 TaxID=2903799 RepID=UPI002DD80399|nr:peptidase [Streptomyces sp. NBC_01257]WRZ66787.1 peptidase [Streptomyces sp. NBC_01257]
MRSTTPRAAARRVAGALAAVGLLAAGSLALGAPARAAGPVMGFGGPAETALHPYPATGAPQGTSLAITVDNPLRDEEHGGFTGAYTVTFDLGGIVGVADAGFGTDGRADGGTDCTVTGTTGVCHGEGLAPGPNPLPELRVTAAEGSEEGDSGTVGVTGTADGVTFAPFTTRIGIGGPDLVMRRAELKRELVPGQTQPVPLAFSNDGTRAADGVLLTLVYTRGIEFTERYENCVYSEDDGGLGFTVRTTALCSVEGSFEAGAAYELAEPLTLRATRRAYRDTFVYRVDEGGPGVRAAERSGARSAPGSKGNVLALTELPAARSADLAPGDNQQENAFSTANTADFVAYGDTADGMVGSTVEADIGFRNEGPAWIGGLDAGEPAATVDFTVPRGASVTGWPDACRGVTADGRSREQQAGAPRYRCTAPAAVREDGGLGLHFDLRIVEAVTGASGRVEVRGAGDAPLPFDPDRRNDTAALVLNADTSGTSGGAGSTGGSGDTGPTTSGSTGGSSATGGSASSGSTGTTGPAGPGPRTGGSLAATGTDALTAAGAAAAALLAGGVLYVSGRRTVR